MKCEQVKGSLSAYLDNQLALEEREAVTAHLQTCVECSNTLVDFRYFDDLLAYLPRVGPDKSLRQKIFSSAEYKEITGTFNLSTSVGDLAVPARRVRLSDPTRPYLIVLPGGRLNQPPSPALPVGRPAPLGRRIFYRRRNELRILYLVIAAILLLLIGLGGVIVERLWQKAGTAHNSDGCMPPKGLLSWSKDGSMLAFVADPQGTNSSALDLTYRRQVNMAQWSPDGKHICYLDAISSDIGTLHIINMATRVDTVIDLNVTRDPTPMWSPDGQHLTYSTGTHVLVVNMQTTKASQPLAIQGLAEERATCKSPYDH